MLFDANLPLPFWAEAIRTATYLKNHTPTSGNGGQIPEEVWTGKPVDLTHLKTFGCQAHVLIPKQKRTKFDKNTKKCVFIGYSETAENYRVIDLDNPREVHVTKHVIFNENVFPAADMSNSRYKKFKFSYYDILDVDDDPVNSQPQQQVVDEQSNVENEQEMTVDGTPMMINEPEIDQEEVEPVHLDVQRQVDLDLNDDMDSDSSFTDALNLDDSVQASSSSEGSLPFKKEALPVQEGIPLMVNSREPRIIKKKEYPDYETDFLAFLAGTQQDEAVPESVHEALSGRDSDAWKHAIQSEFQSHIDNGSWELVDLPADRKAIKCRWVFKIKRNANGEIVRHKARLVAKGCSQRYGVDYQETFSPVVRYSTLRTLMALAVEFNLEVSHLDVSTAFLHSSISEEIYMEQPEGFRDESQPFKVCKLKKAIYGLKQASREWYTFIKERLLELGFTQNNTDPCVFQRVIDDELTIVAVYVDDLVPLTRDQIKKENLVKSLKDHMDINDLGPVKHLLNMKVTQDANGSIALNQTTYIKKVLSKFGLEEAKEVSTPMEVNRTFKEAKDPLDLPYRELIGHLTYLSICTRPDIANAVSRLARFNSSHDQDHWKSAKRVLRYLKATANYSMIYSKSSLPMHGYVDSDWGQDPIDRKSYSGYVFKFAHGAVSWESKRQPTVALSTAEAEYMAMSSATQEAIFLRNFLRDIFREYCKNRNHTSMLMYSDSQSALNLSKNEVVNNRTKHIDIRHHFVREAVEKGLIRFNYLPTDLNIADILTKPLSKDKHDKFVNGLNLRCVNF